MNNYFVDEINGSTIRSEDGKVIADFYIKVQAVIKYISNNRTETMYQIGFYNPDLVCEKEVRSKNLEKFDYTALDDSLMLSPAISSAGKEMAYVIRQEAKKVQPREVVLFDKLGWHNIEGKHLYCAGNIIISPTDTKEYKIDNRLSLYRLDKDKDMSEDKAISYIFSLINIEPKISSIIFSAGVLGVMRQLILDAEIKIPCITYVAGASQTRKTTLVNLCTRLYNRNDLNSDTSVTSMRVSSTEFKSEELADELKDTTFLFDDLYKEASTKLRRAYEARVRNLIRNFADNAPRTTSRSAFKNNCQIIVTAEYVLQSKTDMGRTTLICVEEPIDSERLSKCQKQPLALSTFYYFFIKWIAENYDRLVEQLKEKYSNFRAGALYHKGRFERLYEQNFLFSFVFSAFLEYVIYKEHNVKYEAYMRQFSSYLTKHMDFQNRLLEDLDKNEVKNINLSAELLEMINNHTIEVSHKEGECFRKGGFLYITNQYFAKKLYEKYNRTFSAKSVAAYFRDRYISQVYADNRQKKHKNKCYLILDWEELNKDARNDSSKISNLFFN